MRTSLCMRLGASVRKRMQCARGLRVCDMYAVLSCMRAVCVSAKCLGMRVRACVRACLCLRVFL